MCSEIRGSNSGTRRSASARAAAGCALIVIIASSLVGCGRHEIVVGALRDAAAGDAMPMDASASDASAGGDASTPRYTPFELPEEVKGVLAESDVIANPALSTDMLELYFDAHPNNGSFDIWRTTRDALGAPWKPAKIVTELSTDNYEVEPSLSADGLTIWFASNRPSAGPNRIWVSHRLTPSDPWNALEKIDLGASNSDRGPTTDESGLVLIFYSDRPPADAQDLYMSTRATLASNWSAPVNLSEINSTAVDWDPGLFNFGLGLMYGSTRDTNGEPDLYETSRAGRGSPFSKPERRDELNSEQAEGDPWLSNDGIHLMFTSTRNGVSRLYISCRVGTPYLEGVCPKPPGG